MDEISIRKAKISDAPDINRIYNHSVTSGVYTADTAAVDVDHHEKWLGKNLEEDNTVLIAEYSGKTAGWCSLGYYRFGRPALLHVREISYYVDKDFRGKGVASKLIDSMIKICPGKGITVLLAFVIEGNESSKKLMEKYSFEQWGRLPETVHINGGRYDHLIYGKNIE